MPLVDSDAIFSVKRPPSIGPNYDDRPIIDRSSSPPRTNVSYIAPFGAISFKPRQMSSDRAHQTKTHEFGSPLIRPPGLQQHTTQPSARSFVVKVDNAKFIKQIYRHSAAVRVSVDAQIWVKSHLDSDSVACRPGWLLGPCLYVRKL